MAFNLNKIRFRNFRFLFSSALRGNSRQKEKRKKNDENPNEIVIWQ